MDLPQLLPMPVHGLTQSAASTMIYRQEKVPKKAKELPATSLEKLEEEELKPMAVVALMITTVVVVAVLMQVVVAKVDSALNQAHLHVDV